MGNLIKKLFNGGSKGCCDVKIEEVKTEDKNKEESNINNADKNGSCGEKQQVL